MPWIPVQKKVPAELKKTDTLFTVPETETFTPRSKDTSANL